jgi:hypothetical protein
MLFRGGRYGGEEREGCECDGAEVHGV